MLYQAIVIGTSTGGVIALKTFLSTLPGDFPLPIIIAQHLHPSQDDNFLSHANSHCRLSVKSADDKEAIRRGHVYFAPPNYHLLIEKDKTFSLSVDARVRFSRPSIDVLFESAADVFSSHLIGIVLTGANDDGAAGLREIKRQRGLAIVQDPGTAEADYMPRAALATVDADHILPLEEIGPLLCSLIMT